MSHHLFAMLQSLVLGAAVSAAGCELLVNPGFESVPDDPEAAGQQGYLPNDWLDAANIAPGADAWSNDGSYGNGPGDFGHFQGFQAQEGSHWVAGADFGAGFREGIAQRLGKTLTGGKTYTFSASICDTTLLYDTNAYRGGWELYLSSGPSFQNAVSLGKLAATTQKNTWQSRSLTFTAPDSAASLPYLVLVPYSAQPPYQSYVGIDNVTLTPQSGTLVQETSRLLQKAPSVLPGARRSVAGDRSRRTPGDASPTF